MNLIIDIGNTAIKTAVFDNSSLVSNQFVSEKVLEEELKKTWDGIIVSCVGKLPKIDFSNALILTASTKLPIEVAYKTPHSLGVDRLASAVGATVVFP